MAYRSLSLKLEPPIAHLHVHAGVVDAESLAEIDRAAEAISDEHAVRVVVLSFDGALAAGDIGGAMLPFRSLELMAQPLIACIEGPSGGATLELALACDLRIASTHATFALNAADGRVPSLGGTQRLPRVVGAARAASMLLLGEELDAQAALECGLVNEIVPRGGAQARAADIAATIASRGPIAVRYAKEAIREGLEMPLDQALRYETDLTIILQTTADRTEGVQAFIEKRPPKFEGR
jgi:enoyl-CoA hydratase/carnithine racemase